jgi:amicoumacin kinase
MNPDHKALFERNEKEILKYAREHFGEVNGELTKLGGFESVVYEYTAGSRARILKATHTDRRSSDMIHGEIEWALHLIANNIPCVAPVMPVSDEWVITVPVEDSAFHLYAWEKAPGRKPNICHDGPKLWRQWGAMLGSMHRVTKSYKPEKPEHKRRDWLEGIDSDYLELLREDSEMQKLHNEITSELHELPIDTECFGLVHADLHQGNFFVADGRMTLFDFDDCHYDWFVQDVAMPLFYVFRDIGVAEKNSQKIAQEFFREFIAGYSAEYDISEQWLERIPLFLKQRELLLYLLIRAETDWESSTWCCRFMKDRREALLGDKPVIEFNPVLPHS